MYGARRGASRDRGSKRDPISIVQDEDRSLPSRATDEFGDAGPVELRVDVGEGEAARIRRSGERRDRRGAQVNGDREVIGQRAFGDEKVYATEEGTESGIGSGISRVAQGALRRLDAKAERLRPVGRRVRPNEPVFLERKGLARIDLVEREGEARIDHVVAECTREIVEQVPRSRRTDDGEWVTARLRQAVAEGEEEERQIADVVGVEMGEDDVGDPIPRYSEPRHVVNGSGTTVEEQSHPARYHEVRGAHSMSVQGNGSGPDRNDLHAIPIRKAFTTSRGRRIGGPGIDGANPSFPPARSCRFPSPPCLSNELARVMHHA